jgi:predicted phosphoadenosine phosphosulfate sulfurtransferase
LGYFYDIPDEVPQSLSRENLAPSYKALAIALLNNDHALKSLGMTQPKSKAYSMLKQIELKARKEK